MDTKNDNKDAIDITIKTHKDVFAILEPHINKNRKGVFTYHHNVHVSKKLQKDKCSDQDILNSLIDSCDTSSSFSLLMRLLMCMDGRCKKNIDYDMYSIKNIIDALSLESLESSELAVSNDEFIRVNRLNDSSTLIEKLASLNVNCAMITDAITDASTDNHHIKTAMIDRIKYLRRYTCTTCTCKGKDRECMCVDAGKTESININDAMMLLIRVSWDFSPDSEKTLKCEYKNNVDTSNESTIDSADDWIEYDCLDPQCLCKKIKTKHKNFKIDKIKK